jgi:hypothetical protein
MKRQIRKSRTFHAVFILAGCGAYAGRTTTMAQTGFVAAASAVDKGVLSVCEQPNHHWPGAKNYSILPGVSR